MSREPKCRPRLRPRPTGLRILRVLSVLSLAPLVLWLISMIWRWPNFAGSMSFLTASMLGFLLLVSLVFGAWQHAYAGSPPEVGAVATMWHLRRDPTLRDLPTLPGLPRWRVALGYVPALLTAGLLLWTAPQLSWTQGQTFQGDQFWVVATLKDKETAASFLNYVRVTCQDFPLPTTPQSLCFAEVTPWPGARPHVPLTFQQALEEWVNNNTWLEWPQGDVRREPVRHPAPPFTFSLVSGGGVSGGRQLVRLPVLDEAGREPVWGKFSMDALTKTADHTGRVPPALTQHTKWLRKQVFRSYFVVTPVPDPVENR